MDYCRVSRRTPSPVVLVGLVIGLGCAATGAGTAAPVASAETVPYTFLSGAAQALTAPGTELAGANDWSCRPSERHPEPVVLVHGTLGGAVSNWATYGPLLHDQGYCVFTLTYGARADLPWPASDAGGLADIGAVSVPQVAGFVDRVLEATGARQVDLVGHSQGTLIAGLVAKRARPGAVRTVASLAPLWRGVGGALGAGTATGVDAVPGGRAALAAGTGSTALRDMLPGSRELADLWSDGTPYAAGVRYLNVVTRYDEAVLPYTSGLVDAPDREGYDVRSVVVQDGCEQDWAEHAALASDPRAADEVLRALDPATLRTPRCVPVAPVHGAVGEVPPATR